MAYFSRSAKYTSPTYHIITREPKVKGSGTSGSARHRPPSTPLGSRSNSSAQITTPKALVRKKSANFDHALPNYNAVQSSQSVYGNSRASTPGDTKAAVKGYFEDWDDGNITVQRGSSTGQDEVTIHVNRPTILRLRGRSRSNDWEVVELSDARLGKKPIRASSVGDFRKEDRKELRDYVGKGEPFFPETDLAGLSTCMSLEGHLRHLQRILRLFLDFDELTRDTHNTGTFNGFLQIIYDCSTDIYIDLKALTLWSSQVQDGPAYRVTPLVGTTARVQDIWNKYLHWLDKVSNKRFEDAAQEESALTTYLLQESQDAGMEAAKKMLGLLATELDEGLEEVDKIERNLKRGWSYGMKGGNTERNRKEYRGPRCGTVI